jgi:hypothetical protein
MTKQEHIQKHIDLHNALDELIADWISQEEIIPFTDRPIIELIRWSFDQTINPTNKNIE